MRKILFWTFITGYILAACNNNEIGGSGDVNPESIWFDYQIWGDEEGNNVTVKLQYRFAGPEGTTLLLSPPSEASLDGVPIEADSSKWDGAYYEVVIPVKNFNGEHEIVFTDINKKQYSEKFVFRAFTLRTEPPALVSRNDLVFELEGLDPGEPVKLMISDTVFASKGVERMDTVRNGRMLVRKSELEKLKNGPVHLEIYRDVEKRIKNGTAEGGRISISYSIKREFELRD